MCHADIAPIPFHVNVPARKGIFPRLATTHTCRNFTKIQEWSRLHSAGDWDYHLGQQQALDIIATADFDQGPQENIQELYDIFPGDLYFEHWRENPYP